MSPEEMNFPAISVEEPPYCWKREVGSMSVCYTVPCSQSDCVGPFYMCTTETNQVLSFRDNRAVWWEAPAFKAV